MMEIVTKEDMERAFEQLNQSLDAKLEALKTTDKIEDKSDFERLHIEIESLKTVIQEMREATLKPAEPVVIVAEPEPESEPEPEDVITMIEAPMPEDDMEQNITTQKRRGFFTW